MSTQYEEAYLLLDYVRSVFSPIVDWKNVFFVPGNHDVNRKTATEACTMYLDRMAEDKDYDMARKKIEGMLHGKSTEWRNKFARLREYGKFIELINNNDLLSEPDYLTYCASRTLHGQHIAIVGLNSAWSCCRDSEKGKLWSGNPWHIKRYYKRLQKANLSIVLTHHPASWLVEAEENIFIQEKQRYFNFHLHGHEHIEWVSPSTDHITVAAGAAYSPRHKEAGYNFVRLDLDKGEGEVWLSRYESSGGGGWVPLSIPGKSDAHGCWPLKNLNFLTAKTVYESAPPLHVPFTTEPVGGSSAEDKEVHPTKAYLA